MFLTGIVKPALNIRKENAVSTNNQNLPDTAMHTPKICVFRCDRKKQLQKNK